MELNVSKIMFLLSVLLPILQILKESEAMPMFWHLRDDCGKTSVSDSVPGHENGVRRLPFIVMVVAEVGNKNFECTGSIISLRLVLTSKYCAPKKSKNPRYVIHYDHGRRKPVSKVHSIRNSALMLLEVTSAFRPDFTVCLTFGLDSRRLNDTVWSASRINERLYEERWSFPNEKKCNVTCKTASSERCTCALSDEPGWGTCRGDEGKPVLRWDGLYWYLIGVVTEVHLESGKCADDGRRERAFQSVTFSDLDRMIAIVQSHPSHATYIAKHEKESHREGYKYSVYDSASRQTGVRCQLPWVVGVVARTKNETRICSGTVLKAWIVITSKYCAPNGFRAARYVIHYGSGRQKPVSNVHLIKSSPFIALEVSDPFEPGVGDCPSYKLNTNHSDDTVWAVSWTTEGVRGVSAPGSLHEEQWTLTHLCKDICESLSKRCICALSDEIGGNTCHGDEGKPVMRWDGDKWDLVGMVTNVRLEGRKCVSAGRYERFYQMITDPDWLEVKNIIRTNPPRHPSNECGRGENLQLGPQKEVAPLLLPWIVAVHATTGTRTVNCTGTVIDSRIVLIASACVPKGFENATYTVVHGSIHILLGTKVKVEQMHRSKNQPSYTFLRLALPAKHIPAICVKFGPFDLPGEDVVAASWAFIGIESRLAQRMLYYEKWTLPKRADLCNGEPFNRESAENKNNICGVSGTHSDYACRGDLGQPVMHWRRNRWYLVGMVTHVDVGQEYCKLRKSQKRIFKWISRWSK